MGLSKAQHEELAKKLAKVQHDLLAAHLEVIEAYGAALPYGRAMISTLDGIIMMRNQMGLQAGKEHEHMDWGSEAYGEASWPTS